MKKTFLLSAILLCLLHFTNAQNLSIGPSGGAGNSWLDVGGDQNSSNRFHPFFSKGGKLVYSFESNWGVSAGLVFSSEGGTKSNDFFRTSYRADYIRMPMQGIYFFGKLGDRVRPKIFLGPTIGVFVGGKTRVEDKESNIESVSSSDNVFSSLDAGINTGGGINFRIAKNIWLDTDVTYYHGLIDVFENANGPDVRNRSLSFNLGVTFPLLTVKPQKMK
jgi:Outer membrane protein beta-barrel domain